MTATSRTDKSIKNIIIAVCFLVLNMVLQFFSRDIFLKYLGAEVLGLNTTATNLLQFLNLAELGIGAAVGFSLYRPLFDNDTDSIREIVALQGHLYRRIALVVLGGAAVLSCFFPLIFSKMQLPLWYAYCSFGVLLLGALLSYFVNYKEIVLSADQREYKILYSYRSWMLLRLVAQIAAVRYSANPFIWWVILEGTFAIAASISLNHTIHRSYPYLRGKIEGIKELRGKYPNIVVKIKQVFFHKLSTYVLQQTSPLIIYAYASLTLVAYYGNYMVIITAVSILVNALFNGVNAGIGNLVAEGDKTHILNIFKELFSARFFICALLTGCLWELTQPFISVWIGPEYLLNRSTLALIVIIFYINDARTIVDSFVAAYGMFQDIWAPIVEATLNLGLSVLFGRLWGLNGILGGVLVSLLLIVVLWKPFFLFRYGPVSYTHLPLPTNSRV